MATVQAPSVWPAGSNVSIVGQVTAGDGHVVGATEAHLFGTPVIRLTDSIPVGGVPSAQAFGVPTAIETGHVYVQVGGVASPASFGAPKLSIAIRVPGGVPSAAAFGTFALHTAVTVQVPGVPSPYPPYIPSITGGVISGDGHVVGGIGGAFGYVTIHATITVAVGGVPSTAAIGAVQIVQLVHPLGVPSAQAFGTQLGFIIMGPGVPSAQAFGTAEGGFAVFIVWIRPSDCIDQDLAAVACTDLDLAPADCIDLDLDVLVPT